jgi:hypothetical protein
VLPHLSMNVRHGYGEGASSARSPRSIGDTSFVSVARTMKNMIWHHLLLSASLCVTQLPTLPFGRSIVLPIFLLWYVCGTDYETAAV